MPQAPRYRAGECGVVTEGPSRTLRCPRRRGRMCCHGGAALRMVNCRDRSCTSSIMITASYRGGTTLPGIYPHCLVEGDRVLFALPPGLLCDNGDAVHRGEMYFGDRIPGKDGFRSNPPHRPGADPPSHVTGCNQTRAKERRVSARDVTVR